MLSGRQVRDIRRAFFSTIVSLFLCYEEAVATGSEGFKEFNMKVFKQKMENASNKKFYARFFGNHATIVQNQLFTNFFMQMTDDAQDMESMTKKDRFHTEIKALQQRGLGAAAQGGFAALTPDGKGDRFTECITQDKREDDHEESKGGADNFFDDFVTKNYLCNTGIEESNFNAK